MKNDLENEKIAPAIANFSNFIIIDNSLFLDRRLNSTDIVVYGIIQSLSNNKQNCCYCNNRYIANLKGITTRQVQNCLSKLKRLNYITVDFDKNGYRLIKTDLANMIAKRNENNNFNLVLETFNWLEDEE